MSHELDSKQLDKMAKFEERMAVVKRDDPDRAEACRKVHNMLVNARHVVESVFNDDVADQAEVVLAVHAAIADEMEDIKDERENKDSILGGGGDDDDDE